jgi:hypothetical protein
LSVALGGKDRLCKGVPSGMPIKLRSLGDRADPAQYPQRSARSRRPIPVPVNRLLKKLEERFLD